MRNIDSVIPFLAGVGIGAAVGILLAPDGSDRSRQCIDRLGNRTADSVKALADDLSGAAKELLHGGGPVLDLKDRATGKLFDAGEAVRKMANDVTNKSRQLAQGVGKKLEDDGTRLDI